MTALRTAARLLWAFLDGLGHIICFEYCRAIARDRVDWTRLRCRYFFVGPSGLPGEPMAVFPDPEGPREIVRWCHHTGEVTTYRGPGR